MRASDCVEPVWVHLWHGFQQQFGIGVMGWHEDLLLRPLFDDASLMHDHDLVGDCPDGREIVGDEQVGDAQFLLCCISRVRMPRATSWSRAEVTSSQTIRSPPAASGRCTAVASDRLTVRPIAVIGRAEFDLAQQLHDPRLRAAPDGTVEEGERPAQDSSTRWRGLSEVSGV